MPGILSCLRVTWLWSAHWHGPSHSYYHLKALSQNLGTVDGSGYAVLTSNHPADVKALVNGCAYWIVEQEGRVSLWHFFFLYSLKEVFVLSSLISRLIYLSSKMLYRSSECLWLFAHKLQRVVITGYKLRQDPVLKGFGEGTKHESKVTASQAGII